MTVTYTFDVYSSLDGFASFNEKGDWGGYWGKDGPELLDHRLSLLQTDQRMVLGANTFRQFMEILNSIPEAELDPVNSRMKTMPTTVISSSITGPVDWPDATLIAGDGVETVRRLKAESDVPLRSHGSLSLNRDLMAAGLIDFVQLTIFPAITGPTGVEPVFEHAAEFDLEMVSSRTFDGRIQELIYKPTLHR